jgi:glycerophosphoryl diester phosphodiesterase
VLPLGRLYARTPLILGHRGASGEAPENTLSAFEAALRLGADGVELDVTLSRDGVPVVIHDDTLDRTTTGAGRMSDQSLAELKRLTAGYAARFGNRFAGERIPTLAEVFAALEARAIINVELKRDRTPEGALGREVVRLIYDHQREARVIISSFQLRALQRVRQIAPALPLGALYMRPAAAGRVESRLRQAVCPAAPEAHHPEYPALTPEWLQWYHAHGLRVNTWTVDEPADMRRLAAAGVDGLITNRPEVAVGALRGGYVSG